jgi:ribosomal protein S18 acetylase RimI-like enzyme
MEYGIGEICPAVNKNNESAIAIYKKMGFKTMNSVENDIGEGFFTGGYAMKLSVQPTKEKRGDQG